jgi:protein TonB
MKKLLLLLMIVPIIGFGQELEYEMEDLGELEEAFISVEQMPRFGDCKDVECTQSEIMQFITRNFKYPEISKQNGVEGRVILEFVVEKCGHVDRIKILRGLDKYIDKAAIESIKLLPKFTPGKQIGKDVPVKYTVPIKCTLG